MDAWKNASVLQEKAMSIKFLVLGGGGVLWVWGGGVPILFLWARGFFWRKHRVYTNFFKKFVRTLAFFPVTQVRNSAESVQKNLFRWTFLYWVDFFESIFLLWYRHRVLRRGLRGASHEKFHAAPSKKQARFLEGPLPLRIKGKATSLEAPFASKKVLRGTFRGLPPFAPLLSMTGQRFHRPTGSYSWLRTLPPCKTHCKTPSKKPSCNL